MCIFVQKKTTAGAPSVKTAADPDVGLPRTTDLRREGDVASVEYGSTPKKTGTTEAQRTGTESLKIPLNTGVTGGGGLNV